MRSVLFGCLISSCLISSLSFAYNGSHGQYADINSLAADVMPASRLPREEFTECRSDIQNSEATFYNIGSMCADGLFALMEGRGCENIVNRRDDSGEWTYHYCAESATCDRLHNNKFAVVPVGKSLASFDSGYEMWCADNNYVVLRLSQ